MIVTHSGRFHADEVFATGTMGELTPVKEIDGRQIENKSGSTIRKQLNELMAQSLESHCVKL